MPYFGGIYFGQYFPAGTPPVDTRDAEQVSLVGLYDAELLVDGVYDATLTLRGTHDEALPLIGEV